MRKGLSSTIVSGLVLASFALTSSSAFAYPPQPLISDQASPIEGEKKVTKLNQFVPPMSQIKVTVPKGTVKTVFVLNGITIVAPVDVNGNAKLPVTVGPKDKLVVKFVDSKKQTTTKKIVVIAAPIVLANVNFASTSYELSDPAKAILNIVVKTIKKHGYTNISLTGYTDNEGDKTGFDNSTLSNQRSQAVQDYLQPYLPDANFNISYKGSANPIGDNTTAEGRAANRRTEVSVS